MSTTTGNTSSAARPPSLSAATAAAGAEAGKGQQLLRIVPFDPATMEWPYWKLRLKNHLFLIKVPTDYHVAFLLDALSPEPFELLAKMCKPQEPMDLPIADLYARLDSAYTVPTMWIAQWVKFFSTKQKPEATLIQFSCDLRAKAETCNFPDDVREKNMIAAFVMGLKDEVATKKLCTKSLTTLQDALNAAIEIKMTRKELQMDDMKTEVNKISQKERKNSQGAGKECYRCGRRNHSPGSCYFRDKRCNTCDEKGHSSRKCPERTSNKYISAEERRPYDIL
ncbi:uncharacterized protein LOC129588758 [Paramacrobiotus metropolitanus]|uniref:uncharacterized protein LOC129588758 n=1 Tax=Paramacrobiotus metropolitanus TaxID=2943436 RepID=UPI0024456CFB|nr:uncharacterized protein LOC129588758 [Paramacrobiotus metropolitanus]